MQVTIPNSAFLGNIDGTFFRQLNLSDQNTLDVQLHPKWISVHPLVLAMTAALGKPLKASSVSCPVTSATSVHYLERMGLFSMLGVPSGVQMTEHEPAGRFIPIRQIQSSDGLQRFLQDMLPLLHVSEEQGRSIWYIVSELVRNVLEHARSDEGAFVAAQYYAKSNRISIGIADRGIGIRSALSRSYVTDNDAAAIMLALQPGITGTTRVMGGTEQNAGAGLFFVKSIAKTTRDFMVLYSGSGCFKLLRSTAGRVLIQGNPMQDKHTLRNDLPFWQGTAVGIDFTLDQTPEFRDMLANIRNSYFRTIQDRRREQRWRPTFT